MKTEGSSYGSMGGAYPSLVLLFYSMKIYLTFAMNPSDSPDRTVGAAVCLVKSLFYKSCNKTTSLLK